MQPHEEWEKQGSTGPNYAVLADVFEAGEFRGGMGARNDLKEVIKMVKEQATDWQIVDALPNGYGRAYRFIDKLRLQMPRNTMRETSRVINLHVGPPGSGKTRAAKLLGGIGAPTASTFELPIASNGRWFDGYFGQKYVVIDEFEGSLYLNEILKLLDPWYVRMVPIKGSHVWFDPDQIDVTSNNHPSTWYEYKEGARQLMNREDKEAALRRRFTNIFVYKPTGEYHKYSTTVDIQRYWPIGTYHCSGTDTVEKPPPMFGSDLHPSMISEKSLRITIDQETGQSVATKRI